jgi:hypothetical protein
MRGLDDVVLELTTVLHGKLKELYRADDDHANKLAALEKRVVQLEAAQKPAYDPPKGQEFRGVVIDDPEPPYCTRKSRSYYGPSKDCVPQYPDKLFVGDCPCGGTITQTSPYKGNTLLMAKFGKSCDTCGKQYD